MYMPTGKFEGVSIGSVVLKEPNYTMWLVGQLDMRGSLATARNETMRLITVFNSKQIAAKCHGCSGKATRFTGYEGSSISLYAWCNSCDPQGSSQKASPAFHTYQQALNHNARRAGDKAAGQKRIISAMADRKGLIRPLTEANVAAFFGSN